MEKDYVDELLDNYPYIMDSDNNIDEDDDIEEEPDLDDFDDLDDDMND